MGSGNAQGRNEWKKKCINILSWRRWLHYVMRLIYIQMNCRFQWHHRLMRFAFVCIETTQFQHGNFRLYIISWIQIEIESMRRKETTKRTWSRKSLGSEGLTRRACMFSAINKQERREKQSKWINAYLVQYGAAAVQISYALQYIHFGDNKKLHIHNYSAIYLYISTFNFLVKMRNQFLAFNFSRSRSFSLSLSCFSRVSLLILKFGLFSLFSFPTTSTHRFHLPKEKQLP